VYRSGRLFKTLNVHCVCSSELSVKCGFLYKRGKYHTTWKRRWFVLKPPYLLYYKSKDDKRPKGYIDLIGATVKLGDGSKVNHVRHCGASCAGRRSLMIFLCKKHTGPILFRDPLADARVVPAGRQRARYAQVGGRHSRFQRVL